MKTQDMSYEAPQVEIIEVEVEQGFATSSSSFEAWQDEIDLDS